MKNLYMIERARAIILSLLLLAGGVLFISMPESFHKWLAIIFGIIVIAVGMVRVVLQFTFLVEGSSSLALVTGFTLIGFGSLMICFPEMFLQVTGVVMAIVGIQHCGESFERYKDKTRFWWKDLLYGITLFVLGIAVILMKHLAVKTSVLTVVSGIALILYALFVLIGVFATYPEKQETDDSIVLLAVGNRGVVEVPLKQETSTQNQKVEKENAPKERKAKTEKKVVKLAPAKKAEVKEKASAGKKRGPKKQEKQEKIELKKETVSQEKADKKLLQDKAKIETKKEKPKAIKLKKSVVKKVETPKVEVKVKAKNTKTVKNEKIAKKENVSKKEQIKKQPKEVKTLKISKGASTAKKKVSK